MKTYPLCYEGKPIEEIIRFCVIVVCPLVEDAAPLFFSKYPTYLVSQSTEFRDPKRWIREAPWNTLSEPSMLAWAPHVAKDLGYEYLYQPVLLGNQPADLNEVVRRCRFIWEDGYKGILSIEGDLAANLNQREAWDEYAWIAEGKLQIDKLRRLVTTFDCKKTVKTTTRP
jgi:hypothetical protein